LAAPVCSWLLLAAPGCSWLLLAAPGGPWLLLAGISNFILRSIILPAKESIKIYFYTPKKTAPKTAHNSQKKCFKTVFWENFKDVISVFGKSSFKAVQKQFLSIQSVQSMKLQSTLGF
jgi:hypothetical protein